MYSQKCQASLNCTAVKAITSVLKGLRNVLIM